MDDNPNDKYGTAICPKCGVYSLIGECTGYPIAEEFLDDMYSFWMTGNDDGEDEEDDAQLLTNHKCPVCGKFNFDKWNSLEICDNCGWQDDGLQADNPDEERCANQMSLNQAKIAYANGQKVM